MCPNETKNDYEMLNGVRKIQMMDTLIYFDGPPVPPHGKDSHNLPTPAKATKMMELKMRIVSITALIWSLNREN